MRVIGERAAVELMREFFALMIPFRSTRARAWEVCNESSGRGREQCRASSATAGLWIDEQFIDGRTIEIRRANHDTRATTGGTESRPRVISSLLWPALGSPAILDPGDVSTLCSTAPAPEPSSHCSRATRSVHSMSSWGPAHDRARGICRNERRDDRGPTDSNDKRTLRHLSRNN